MGWLASTTTTAVISLRSRRSGAPHSRSWRTARWRFPGPARRRCWSAVRRLRRAPTMPAAAWRPRMPRRPPPGHGRVCWACRSCHPCRPCRRRWPWRAFLRHGGGFAALGRGGLLAGRLLGRGGMLGGGRLARGLLGGGALPAACLGTRPCRRPVRRCALAGGGFASGGFASAGLGGRGGGFLACCALQAADLALVLQGSEFSRLARRGRSAHIASAMGAIAFAIARVQVNAMVSAGLSVCIEMFRTPFVGHFKKSR